MESEENRTRVSLAFHSPWKSLARFPHFHRPDDDLTFTNHKPKGAFSGGSLRSRLQAHSSMRKCCQCSAVSPGRRGCSIRRLRCGGRQFCERDLLFRVLFQPRAEDPHRRTVVTVAGSGQYPFGYWADPRDGRKATESAVNAASLALDGEGNLYPSDPGRVSRSPCSMDGILHQAQVLEEGYSSIWTGPATSSPARQPGCVSWRCLRRRPAPRHISLSFPRAASSMPPAGGLLPPSLRTTRAAKATDLS